MENNSNFLSAEQLAANWDEIHAKIKQILSSKGNDYASEDKLGLIKRIAENNKCCNNFVPLLMLIEMKIGRLQSLLLGNKVVKNEPVEDSILDLIGYAALLYSMKKTGNANANNDSNNNPQG